MNDIEQLNARVTALEKMVLAQSQLADMQTKINAEQAISTAAVGGALHVITELLLSASPEQKKVVAEAVGQMLDRPDLFQEPASARLLEILRTIHQVATRPSRTTPEGRRSWLHLVQPQDPPSSAD